MNDTRDGARAVLDDHLYKALAVSAIVLLVIGTVAFRLLEDWSWVDSFYFSSIAVTTVGFGDLTPTTDASKLFTVFYVFAGISLVTTYLNARAKRRGTRRVSHAKAHRSAELDDGFEGAEDDGPHPGV